MFRLSALPGSARLRQLAESAALPENEWNRGKIRLAAARTFGYLSLFFLLATAFVLPFKDITASREIAIIAGGSAWLLRLAASGKWKWTRTPLDLPIFLFVLCAILSYFTAIDPHYTLREIRGELLKGLLLFYTAVNNIGTQTRAKIIFAFLIAGVICMNVFGVIHYVTVQAPGPEIYREASLASNVSDLVIYLVQTLPFVIAAFILNKNKKVRVGLAVLLFLHLALGVFTFSRILLIAFAFQAVLFFYFYGGRARIPLSIALVGGLILLNAELPRPFVLPGDTVVNEIRIGPVGIEGLKNKRLHVWHLALEQLKTSPVKGLGLGRRSFIKKYPQATRYDKYSWHVHNLFLSLAVETGLQGVVVFLFLLYRIVRTCFIKPRFAGGDRDSESVAVAHAVFALVAGFVMCNMVNHHFVNEGALLFWLLTGTFISTVSFKKPE